jgi:uncharacterized protein (DUF58 family)
MTWPFLRRMQSSTLAPLLDAAQLERLRRAAAAGGSPLLQQREVRQPQLGERPSLIQGSGLDFDESRPFQAGDDRRFINWRLFARTGELSLTVFREERRPQLTLLLDRRRRMRMGSHGRLKLTQAASLAVLLALLARREELAVGAVCLQPQLHYLRGRSGETALADLIRALTAAAPPLEEVDEPSLSQALAQLQQLPRGSLVCLISDFADLREEDSGLLWQLVREHDVSAFHISDAMEHELPASGRLRIDAGGETLELDCGDPDLRAAYARRMRARHEEIERLLTRAGVRYQAVRGDADVVALLCGEGGHGG